MEEAPKNEISEWDTNSEPAASGWEELANLGGDFESFKEKNELERTREQLYERVIDMTTVEAGELKSAFKSGVFLFHGARVEQIEQILNSGELMNAAELYSRKLASRRAELEAAEKNEEEIQAELKKIFIPQNSGQEGISWSANGIDALPGTRGHLAGFVAAPEDVLGANKLVVPSRPAPYELLQVSEGVRTKEFFEAKKQSEVWGYQQPTVFESASVDSGLMRLIIAAKYEREHGNDDDSEAGRAWREPLLLKFAERGGLPPEELRKRYKMDNNGDVEIDERLHQQKFDEGYIPPAAVWMQAMIDKGMFKGTSCDGFDVAKLVKRSFEDETLPDYMLYWAREEGKKYQKRYEEELDKAQGIALPIEKMYLVTSHGDLDKWMEVMTKSGHKPKGILLYDDAKVVRENFAQKEPGDHRELAEEIGRTIGTDETFWQNQMDMDVERMPRAGHMGQVIAEDAVKHDREVRLEGGELKVVNI